MSGKKSMISHGLIRAMVRKLAYSGQGLDFDTLSGHIIKYGGPTQTH